MSEPQNPRPVLIALCAAVGVLILNVVIRLIFKFEGMPVTIGIAFAVAGLVAMWFIKAIQRAPTAPERGRFLWTYSALITVPYLALFVLAAATRGFNGAALFILVLHSLAYPAAAQMFLSEKRLNAMLAKKGKA